MYKTTPAYLKLIEEISSQDLLDVSLRLRVFFGTHKLKVLASLFPTRSSEQLLEATNRTDKLLDDAISAEREFQFDRSDISARFVAAAKVKFPEFSERVIHRYLTWGELKTIIGTSYDRELTNQKLAEMGVYDAAALLDERAYLNRPKPPPNHRESYPLPTLIELFPQLSTSTDDVRGVLRRVDELANYCSGTAPERSAMYNHFYEQRRKVMRAANPGFLEKSYAEALKNALWCLR